MPDSRNPDEIIFRLVINVEWKSPEKKVSEI